MFEGVTITHIIQIAGLLGTGSAALFGVWWRIELRNRRIEELAAKELREVKELAERRIREVEEDARSRTRNAEQVLDVKVAALLKELNEFKLYVAENYASYETVKEIEKRLTDMPDAVADRIIKFMNMQSNLQRSQ